MALDIVLCVGAPVLIMILAYIVQAGRFDVIEGQGCASVVHQSLPAIFIIFMWPVVFGFISAIYGGKPLFSHSDFERLCG